MGISEEKMKIVINNYFKSECNVNTSIREAFEKGFRIGVKKGLAQSKADTPQTECPVAIVFGCDECHRPKCDYKNCRRCKWFVTDKCHECFDNELFEDSGYVVQTERSK